MRWPGALARCYGPVRITVLSQADQKSGQKAKKYRGALKKCPMVEVLVGDGRTNESHQSVISAEVDGSELAEADQKSGRKALKYR